MGCLLKLQSLCRRFGRIMVSEAGHKNNHDASQGPATPSSSRSVTPAVSENSDTNFIWIDDTATSSASGGRRGIRRKGADRDKVRRHAATVSSATRLATIRRKNLDGSPGSVQQSLVALRQQSSESSQESSQERSSQSGDTPPWYLLRLLGHELFQQDAIRFNTVNQKSYVDQQH